MGKSKVVMFNPALMFGIGLFPLIIVSATLKMAFVYALLMFMVLSLSYTLVGLFKTIIPHRVRLICYALAILSSIYFLDSALHELFPVAYESLHGLVVYLLASSIIIYLLETGLKKERFGEGFKTVAIIGSEYSLIMLVVGLIREILGFGTLWGKPLVEGFEGLNFFTTFAGGIMIVLIIALIYNSIAGVIKKRIDVYNNLVKRYSAVIDSNVEIPEFEENDENAQETQETEVE